MDVHSANPLGSRSTFVTVLAWVFIVLAGFSTLISVMQNVMINVMIPFDQIPNSRSPGSEQMPAFFNFMFGHIHLFFLSFLVLSAATLLAAIGLLRRKNWARMTFVGILSLGIVWNVGSVVFQLTFFSSMAALPANAPPHFDAEFDRMATIMLTFTIIMAVGFSLLCAWLIKRLLSGSVRAEFQQAP